MKIAKKLSNVVSFRIDDEAINRISKIQEVSNMTLPLADVLRNALSEKLKEYEKVFNIKH